MGGLVSSQVEKPPHWLDGARVVFAFGQCDDVKAFREGWLESYSCRVVTVMVPNMLRSWRRQM